MKFTILKKHRKQGRRRVFGILSRSKRWIAVIPFTLQVLVTIGIVEYFAVRNLDENTDIEISSTLNDASEEVLLRLNNYLENVAPENLNSIISQSNQPISRELSELLQQLESEMSQLDEILLVTENGSVVASNSKGQLTSEPNQKEQFLIPLTQLAPSLSNRQIQKFSLMTAQSKIAGQIAPLSDNRMKQPLLVVVTVRQPRTAIDAVREQNKLRIRYLSYLLSSSILGILTYLWLDRSINIKSSRGDTVEQNSETFANRMEERDSSTNIDLETFALGKFPEDGDRLQQLEGNYIKSTLVADMSHELRSPLNAILGFAQIMQHSLTDQSQRENLAIINRSGKRLLSIINELVDLSKIEIDRLSLERRSFDFCFWLDSLEQNLKFQAQERNITFSVIREVNLPQYICLDELRLRQIILNLLDYSMRCSQSGTINLRVSCSSRSSTPRVGQELDIFLEVENPGLVIALEERAGLFDPAFQVRQEYQSSQSSSLSLPVSRKLAQLMGGDITVHRNNRQPQSTAFRLNVRTEIASNYDLQIQSAPREISGLELNQPDYRILVVDDSKTNRKIMVQLLERVGFKVREAVNGREAVDEWLRWQPHMIWMDLKMPVMNGYEATEQIKSRASTPSPAIVALTASTSEEERSLFRESGCDDFVGKPFAENIIFDKIAQHLGVRYVYQTTVPPIKERFQLTGNSLQIMSYQWIEQIEQAAASLDAELLTVLLRQIPPEHSELTNALQKLIDNFDFDKILSVVEQSKSESAK